MSNPSAAKSGTFQIGGSLPVHRLGFGAMRITGKGIWGPPADVAEAERTLKRLSEIGIDFIDTANSYGPDVSEALIAKALHPYQQGLVIATKGGLTRPGPDQWVPRGDPAYLRECVMQSLKRLKLDTIALWQLHRIDPGVPREKQFEEIAKMQKEGLIQHVGLSEVSVEEIAAAQKFFTVATVQNLYNLVNRQSEAVLDFCEAQNIGFIPWFPLAAGSLANAGSLLQTIANKHQGQPVGHRARVGAQAQPGDAADTRHQQGRPPRREHPRRRDHPERRRLQGARPAGPGRVEEVEEALSRKKSFRSARRPTPSRRLRATAPPRAPPGRSAGRFRWPRSPRPAEPPRSSQCPARCARGHRAPA